VKTEPRVDLGELKMDMEKIAKWAFTAFVILAVVMGLAVGYMAYNNDPNYANANAYVTLVMLVLGVLVGLVSITAKEAMPFMIATIALIVASSANVWHPLETIHPLLSDWATAILNFIVAFAAPAAVINAIKAAFAMAREK
jgi:FtsH-binding integral membrane protein